MLDHIGESHAARRIEAALLPRARDARADDARSWR
jgi:hypothetical protein